MLIGHIEGIAATAPQLDMMAGLNQNVYVKISIMLVRHAKFAPDSYFGLRKWVTTLLASSTTYASLYLHMDNCCCCFMIVG